VWPFKPKTPSRASFRIDKYRLDAPIAGLSGLVEFSANQYAAMGGRVFEGERNYNAPAIDVFGDRKWNVTLQTVNGFISKIAINVVLSTEREANQVAMRLLGYCMEIEKLGKPNEQYPGFFIWDTTDGNVILQTGETADGRAVALFLTSRAVRNFKKRIDDTPTQFERPLGTEDKPATEVTEPTFADLYDQKP
jgi:hypothetical protein